MKYTGPRAWRVCFVLGGLLYIAGGSQHPQGLMVEMLADPVWVPSHFTIFVGLCLMTAGLFQLFRQVDRASTYRKWLGFAVVMSALEALEMAMHTIAKVDAVAMAAGDSTPVLNIHIWMAIIIYSPFAVSIIGLIWSGQRSRHLGSPWIGWVGILGALAHGTVMWLAVVLEIGGSGILFPLAAMLLSAWFILAGAWPTGKAGVAVEPAVA